MRRRVLLCALAGLVVAYAGVAAGAAPPAASAAATGRDTLPLILAPVQVIGGSDSTPAVLVEPCGVAADAFGRIYVTDAAQHRLVRFEPGGAWLGEAGALGSDVGGLRRPAGVTAMGSLGVAVLDRENRRGVLYDLFGRLTGVLVDLAALEEELGRVDPVALAADRGGALHVADADRDRVLVLDFTGAYVRTLGGFGTAAGSFRGLATLACGPRGDLVTVERTGARVQRLDAGGSPAALWPLPVPPGRGALAVAVDDSSRVAVTDESAGALWIFDRSGRLLGTCSGLAAPRSVTFAPDGSVLVAEAAAGRVRRFALEPSGVPTRSEGPTAPPGR
jgi:DNA-binding beta-propeller fold protein YncE